MLPALILSLLLSEGPCVHGGSGVQCMTCDPTDRGTITCRAMCYNKTGRDGGHVAEHLKTEDKTREGAKVKMEALAKERCK